MPVLMVIVVLVVFGVVIFLATGRGGEMSRERNDFVPLDLGPVTATDIALLRPPTALWGYNMQATDDAMDQIAASIRERDVRIVALEQLVTDLSRDHAPALPLTSPYPGARHRRAPGSGPVTESLSGLSGPAGWSGEPGPAAQADTAAWADSVDDNDPAPGYQEIGYQEAGYQETGRQETLEAPAFQETDATAKTAEPPETAEHPETAAHQEITAPDPVRLDFDPARPGSEQPGPPPEQAHD